MCDSARYPQATHHRQHRQVWAEPAEHTKTVFVGNHRETGHQPDPRLAQIEHLKTENTKLRERLSTQDTEIITLQKFRTEALSRLAAQHDEITTLRDRQVTPSTAQIYTLPPSR